MVSTCCLIVQSGKNIRTNLDRHRSGASSRFSTPPVPEPRASGGKSATAESADALPVCQEIMTAVPWTMLPPSAEVVTLIREGGELMSGIHCQVMVQPFVSLVSRHNPKQVHEGF